MSRTPNYHNPYSGGTPSRSPGFSPYSQNRNQMGPPGGPRQGFFPPQHGDSPMGGGGPGMMPAQRFTPRNSSPFSPPACYGQSPYQQSPSPHHSGGRGRGHYDRRDSRGRGGRGQRGRGGEPFTPSGHQQFHNRRRFSQGGSPYQRGQYGNASSDIERYFKPTMLEDPWRDLVAKQSSSAS